MNRQIILACCIGFISGVFTLDRIEGLRNFLPLLIGLSISLVIVEVLIQVRSRRKQAFTKMLDSYVIRHENDLSQSGAHIF